MGPGMHQVWGPLDPCCPHRWAGVLFICCLSGGSLLLPSLCPELWLLAVLFTVTSSSFVATSRCRPSLRSGRALVTARRPQERLPRTFTLSWSVLALLLLSQRHREGWQAPQTCPEEQARGNQNIEKQAPRQYNA